ncbi:hypothetical protein HKBW3S03_00056 [Candidatus Hakubella thermalkaliphila]|uniref:Uncharacterized protein n=1 Tax=Candidatus Hakubella thermalkaliphila TaxID=2754717 RepID=A0A6V8NGS5_9ACTN|nr:hypothetical protein [Candidatus Hakubella thermalkaliphila]MBT9167171.1 hypothetical protein [Bacillota bacterium]GFP18551.1 hypothetical protein HKBW3S03_00056 [Candidatus Hakubella thermalkaliphila]GFP23611.1 hypothetical protein HKBW3S09_01076 [Candidatus Hakubella thermalkaliphila]GFP30016.1 hypothetical protein HKBW3S34_00936 [Candidatus Hakubella thermalkaliphila]GFP37121.1 hypothetical protein HKBW3S44_00801 [Candidatus Hakubella thermalkaliphila]
MNKDFELKIRLNNVFWSLGCYTRLEVKLAEYSLRKIPMELTDLDVLGIRILPDLNIDYLVADCTSNKDAIRSPIQRVFWLKGVMDFFGASKGYLSLGTSNPIPEAQRIVAHKLGVTILNESNLVNLEKRVVNLSNPQLQSSKPESWLYFENNLTNLSKELVPLLKFRKHNYWINPAHQNLHALISLVTKHNELFDEMNKLQKALILDLLTLFTLSVLQMSAYVFRINPENPEIELKSYFYGGHAEMKRRLGIVENIKKLMESMPIQRSLFNDTLKLDPDYLPGLFDISFRLLNRPSDSSQILRYLQTILFEKILYKGEGAEAMEYLETDFSDIAKKLTRDIVKFFRDSTGIPQRLVDDVY